MSWWASASGGVASSSRSRRTTANATLYSPAFLMATARATLSNTIAVSGHSAINWISECLTMVAVPALRFDNPVVRIVPQDVTAIDIAMIVTTSARSRCEYSLVSGINRSRRVVARLDGALHPTRPRRRVVTRNDYSTNRVSKNGQKLDDLSRAWHRIRRTSPRVFVPTLAHPA